MISSEERTRLEKIVTDLNRRVEFFHTEATAAQRNNSERASYLSGVGDGLKEASDTLLEVINER